MGKGTLASQSLAAAITKAASKQTYYTILWFVDRGRVGDAFRAYAYFRWVDDVLDAESGARSEKLAFADRQRALLEACYRGEVPEEVSAEEQMLVDLVSQDDEKYSGLQTYLRNMMAVMEFDARRRYRIISQTELFEYTRALAVAVTEALHYFIGHGDPQPGCERRYHAVTAAHITHMLRDAHEDAQAGYFNLPGEYLQKWEISPQDLESRAYREWVRGRVELARSYFEAGQECTVQVRSLRCRLAGFAYTARFEWMLRAIEHDDFHLRLDYPERKGLQAGLWMAWSTLTSMLASIWANSGFGDLTVQPDRVGKR
jgi:phytoene/squalene synthetase